MPAPQDFAGAGARVAEYEEEFGAEPGTWSPYTHDSLNLLADGVEKAGGAEATVVVLDTDESGALHVDEAWAKAVGAPY